jgi:aspartyl-tRNA(Asn)/glutamyl-tRNA(Gln) amidotransferase subunit B
MAAGVDGRRAAAILLNNLARRANERGCRVDELGITPAQIQAIEGMAAANKIGSNAADELYGLCCAPGLVPAPGVDGTTPLDPVKLAEQKGLLQVSDDAALGAWVDQALAANPKAVEAIRGGKEAAIGSLVGAVMKLSKGQANAKVVGEMIRKKITG